MVDGDMKKRGGEEGGLKSDDFKKLREGMKKESL